MAIRDKELYHERDVALYNAYKDARKKLFEDASKKGLPLTDIHTRAIRMAINTPQPRFWITQDRAYRIVRVLLKGKTLNKTWPTKRKMYEELLSAYRRMEQCRMFKGMPVIFITSFLTFEPASGFFMSFSRALRAIKIQRQEHKAAIKRANLP